MQRTDGVEGDVMKPKFLTGFERVFLIVLDSVGVGAMPDAAEFGDEGADTLGHVLQLHPDVKIGNLRSLGFTMIGEHWDDEIKLPAPRALCGKLEEESRSKDTLSGHWEMMGVITSEPFRTFPDGFPDELVRELEKRSGHFFIGNVSASGTKILDELGEQSIREGKMILYTSADSVLQIAASEETVGCDELYRVCGIARELTMRDEWKVGRVIARPLVGAKSGEFERTANRKDYAVSPGRTFLNDLEDNGFDVIGIGKIGDIFSGEGLTESYHSDSSAHGMEQTIEVCRRDDWSGLCFVNLVDFDSKWGHRRDPDGYARELEVFDEKLGRLMPLLRDEDLLLITADHGNDPTYSGTDHTREYVPLVAWHRGLERGADLDKHMRISDIGSTALAALSCPQEASPCGTPLSL